MGWEHRGSNRYYYRKRRVGARVVSEYMGTGELAGLLAAMDEEWQIGREFISHAERLAHAEEIGFEEKCRAAEAVLQEVLVGVLSSAGYHRHKGQWRFRRS